ncbi:MAG: hypothetical protein WBF17_13340, partial [Phycisphaerae bacterium]
VRSALGRADWPDHASDPSGATWKVLAGARAARSRDRARGMRRTRSGRFGFIISRGSVSAN